MNQTSQESLTHRWQEKVDGVTRRDATLSRLREACHHGARGRPTEFDLRGIDLSGEDLSGLDLSGYDLRWANLARANLGHANLAFSRLDGATLQKADLEGAEFMGASLVGTVLDECRGERVGFGAANLEGATLIGARLPHSTFSKAIMRGVDARAAVLTEARLVEADLTGCQLVRAVLGGCDLEHAIVKNADFSNTDLRWARLMHVADYQRARWIGADIRDIDMRGAYLVKRWIADENYLFEFRTRDRLHQVLYWLWWLTSDCGRSALRWSLVVFLAVVAFGLVYSYLGVDFASVGEGPFAPFYFSVVTMTTLGYGDIHPNSTAAQIVASAEALFGYIGLGGLLSILGNNMGRRAE